MSQSRLSWRAKLAIIAVFVIVGVALLFVPSPLSHLKQNEEATCREKCSQLQKSWRLVPAIPNELLPPGKFNGPWTCECH